MSFIEIPRPDGRGSPVKICGYAAACFTWRTAVSQIKHQQMLTQINRLEQTAGKGDKKQQEPCSRVFHFIADTQQGETGVLIVIGRGK